MKTISFYISLIKFSHTLFAMPFAVIGFFLGIKISNTEINWKLFALVILCMVFARNAAMAFNRWTDKYYDSKNVRTQIREIPKGIISSSSALTFVFINSFLFILTSYFINFLCFFLSPIALLVILGYSYTKRFTSLCHLILGLGLSLAPVGAFLAVTGEFKLLPLLYSFVVLFWVSGFDIIYALQDEGFDCSQKLKSIPVLLGKKNALTLSSFFHLISSVIILLAGYLAGFHLWYWIGSAIFILLIIRQHTIVSSDDLSKVNVAFFTINGIASIVFSIFFLLELYF
ncbi:MAG: UbiA-like polyprenyltransferase [Bacteroidota bacterium]